MRVKSLLRHSIIAAVALAITAGTMWVDREVRAKRAMRELTSISHQISVQAESLAFLAREKGDHDPFRWAADRLSQGAEPRTVRVSRIQLPAMGLGRDTSTFDTDTGAFEYIRLVAPENGTALKIEISHGAVRFLGSESKWANDLSALVLFAILAVGLFFATRRKEIIEEEGPDFKALARNWLKDAKTLLVELGTHIRETVRNAHDLAVAAAKSRNSVSRLRERIHKELKEIHDSRTALKAASEYGTRVEVLALNLVLESSRIGEKGNHLIAMAEDLRKQVATLRSLHDRTQITVMSLERKLEPLSADADIAFHSYEEVFKTTAGMDGNIRKTTESLLAQAKLIKTANGDMGDTGS